MVKTVFLDRDGVINYLIQRDNITTAPWEKTEFKFIPGSISAILRLKTLRLKVIVVTNQPDVNDGMMELETLEYFNKKLLDVGVDEVLVARLLERGKTSGRVDDQDEEKIRNRYQEYNEKTAPLMDYYKAQNKFHAVDGIGSIQEITERLTQVIDNL